MTRQRLTVYLAAALLCAGCANQPSQKYTARKTPPPVNLTGFPPAYKQGYVDACGSAKSSKRFKVDKQYSQGWRDGAAFCGASSKPRTVVAGSG